MHVTASPLAGWYTDRKGPEWACTLSSLLALPWFGLLVVRYNLAFFIAMFCLQSVSVVLLPGSGGEPLGTLGT